MSQLQGLRVCSDHSLCGVSYVPPVSVSFFLPLNIHFKIEFLKRTVNFGHFFQDVVDDEFKFNYHTSVMFHAVVETFIR